MPAETHVSQGPIGPDEVYRILRERLAEILENDEDRITLESNFTEDELGERTVGFSIDDEDLGELHTVQEAVDYVVARLGE
jgi:acyl carrier protein